MAEIELILATTSLLGKVGFQGFTVRINDRRILKAMAEYSGFPTEQFDEVFIILDKMDKIGIEGVAAELKEAGFAAESVDQYLSLFTELEQAEDGVLYIKEKLGEVIEGDAASNLKEIMDCVSKTTESSFRLVFDPTLVRGMSYYTGTIFEIEMEGFSGSVAGGGRYDEMVGKFTGVQTCACGFSIGFERIVTILLDQNYQVPAAAGKIAYLVEKGMDSDRLCQVMQEAQAERAKGVQVLVSVMNKNKKFQKNQLMEEGYTEFKEFYKNPLK